MGNGIAHVFAQHHYEVHLIDISESGLKKGLATISKNLDRQINKEIITTEEKEHILGRIKTFTKVEDGAKDAELVVEAAS